MAKLTDDEKVKDLMQKFSYLERERQNWETEWQEVADFVSPRRSNFQWNKEDRGKRTGTKIYDGTAQGALQLLADGLLGYLVSPSSDWFRLAFENSKIGDLPGARLWLQEVEKVLYWLFNHSNFYESISQIFMDGGSIGTATLYIEEDLNESGIHFSARHPKEVYVEENRYGHIDTVYRRYYLPMREAIKAFGKDKFDESFIERAEDEPYTPVKVLHIVVPREDRDFLKIDQKNKAYASIYILEEDRKLLREGGYETNPYVVWRWRTNTDEIYGRSPAWDALSDVLKSQQISKTMMKKAHQSVDPAMMYPAELTGQLQLDPGGRMPYRDPNRQVVPVNYGSNYPIGRDQEQAIQTAIKEHFRVDFFLMLSSMIGQKMTATQVVEMQAEKAAVLGAVLGRLTNELLDPTFDRVFAIAQKAGWLPPPPPALAKYSGSGLKIDYIGPLAQKQKQFINNQGLSQALGQLLPLAEFNPAITDLLNWDEVGGHILRSTGAPEKVIATPEERQAIRTQRQQLQQAALQLQAGQAQADIVNKTSKAPEPGSPAEKLTAGQEE